VEFKTGAMNFPMCGPGDHQRCLIWSKSRQWTVFWLERA